MTLYVLFLVPTDLAKRSELDCNVPATTIVLNEFRGSLDHGKDINVTNSWAEPGGNGFMIRGKTYLNDFSKVSRFCICKTRLR